MSTIASIRIEGVPELQAAFDRVSAQFGPRPVKAVLSRAATPIRRAMKREAPVGPTGNLRRSIRKKSLRGDPPAVSVRPDFKIAPHAHLVVRGTGERFHLGSGVTIGRLRVGLSGKSVGSMPANDFVARAEKQSESQARQIMFAGFKALLDRAGR